MGRAVRTTSPPSPESVDPVSPAASFTVEASFPLVASPPSAPSGPASFPPVPVSVPVVESAPLAASFPPLALEELELHPGVVAAPSARPIARTAIPEANAASAFGLVVDMFPVLLPQRSRPGAAPASPVRGRIGYPRIDGGTILRGRGRGHLAAPPPRPHVG